jgi:2-aminoadipate transaminase
MHSLLSRTARTATTSAIRDLLEHARRPGMISLAGGLPDPARFPIEKLAATSKRLLLEHGRDVLQYGLTAGDATLREHIVETTSASGIDEVVVTTGSQRAQHLISQVLLDPGDTVIVGDPEYLGALQAFRARDAHLAAVPIDGDGIDVDAIEATIEAGCRPKLVYTVPHFHNPSGTTLSESRRERLLQLADRHQFMVIFDDPYRELGELGSSPPEPARHRMAVELRSVSKILAPGLRVGWMIGPRWLSAAAERAKQSADLHTSSLSQAITLDARRSEWYPGHLNALRTSNLAKRDTLCSALREVLGARIEFDDPAGGMFVWARFTDGTDTTSLLESALDRGVAFVPGRAFAVDRDLRSHLRLSWATTDVTTLPQAVDRLAG